MRRIVGRCEPLPEHGPSGPGFGGGGPRGKRRTGEWRSQLPGSRLGGGGGMRPWPRSAVGSKDLVGPRASVFFGQGAPFSPCAGAALWFGPAGFLSGNFAGGGCFRALPEPWKWCLKRLRGLQAASTGGVLADFSPARQALQAHAVGLCLGACRAARARRRRRRLRMLVCPSPSSGDAAPQRGRPSSRGRCRIARFGATARGAEVPPARPSRAEPATAHEASGRALPRARSSGHPPPAPDASSYWGNHWGNPFERLAERGAGAARRSLVLILRPDHGRGGELGPADRRAGFLGGFLRGQARVP